MAVDEHGRTVTVIGRNNDGDYLRVQYQDGSTGDIWACRLDWPVGVDGGAIIDAAPYDSALACMD